MPVPIPFLAPFVLRPDVFAATVGLFEGLVTQFLAALLLLKPIVAPLVVVVFVVTH